MEVAQPRKKIKLNSRQTQSSAVPQRALKKYAKLPLRLKHKKRNSHLAKDDITLNSVKSSKNKQSGKSCKGSKNACAFNCTDHYVPISDDESNNSGGDNDDTDFPVVCKGEEHDADRKSVV